jgi:hypothetical protein
MERTGAAYNLTRVMNLVLDQAADGCDRGLRPSRSWLLTDLPGKGVFTRPRLNEDFQLLTQNLSRQSGGSSYRDQYYVSPIGR